MQTENDTIKFIIGFRITIMEVLTVEVIYKDSGKLILPKNVKQIGTKSGKRVVYIEDYAYSFIRDIKVDEDDDGAVGILLGEVKKADGVTYVFIKGVVEVLNAAVYTDHIAFTQETWPITKKYISQYFSEYDILGWYLASGKITEENMEIINKADKESFSDEDNVFFMVNEAAGDEGFWQKGKDGLELMSGYTVYYEKNPSMQRYMKENQSEYDAKYSAKSHEEAEVPEETSGEYRKAANNKNGNTIKRNLTAIYALSMLVIIVVLVIGVNKINQFGKDSGNNSGGGTVAADANVNQKPSKTPVTSLEANIKETEPTTEEPTTEEPTTEEPTTEEPTTEEPTTEAPKKEDVIYVVKAGDGLWRICVNAYGKYDEAWANNILAYNGIGINDLQVGVELKIPSVE